MKYILALDQGTTGSRAILYDKNGQKVTSAYEEFPQYFPQPGWVEHDPAEIWQSIINSIQKVLEQIDPADIGAIGITNQRETTVLWDKKTGKPVYNAIVWQCRRTAKRCSLLKNQKKLTASILRKTGLPVDAYFSATKIEWILKNVPAARALAKTGDLLFGTTDTWLLWKLTGGQIHATDFTNASRTMLFNIETREWDRDLLKIFKIPSSILPAVKKSSGIFGHTVKNGKLPAKLPISGIAGDQQAALFGQTCFTPGTIKNTYGTGCFMMLNTGNKKVTSRHGLITTLACSASGDPVYALEGAVFVAGAAIQWLRDQLQIISSAAETETLANSLPDNQGVYFVPAFVGLGSPHWEQNVRGAIYGITRGTTRAHLVRAALEAMCYQTREVIMAMQQDAKLKVRELKIDGGAVANNFLAQFQADQLGIPIVRPSIIETTSLGAAYLAGLAVNFWSSTQEIKKCWKADKVFSPEKSPSNADRYFAGWQKAIERTKSFI